MVIKAMLCFPLYLPHYICFCANVDGVKRDLDNFNRTSSPSIFRFFDSISNDEFFHQLFFHRIKKLKIRYFFYRRESTFVIPYDVELGQNITVSHPTSTFLNAVRIGNKFHCKNNLTIGNVYDDESQRPTIGDNVYVGCNVVIIGKINIGNNVTIGAGAVVIKDIPDGKTVVGNPARIIK